MGILIGMDEAGYGPNLGPLVVAATAWEVKDGVGSRESGVGKKTKTAAGNAGTLVASRPGIEQHDLYRSLRSVVCRSASERKIAIADSKQLYKPGLGLRQLERGLHAVLLAMRQTLGCWSTLVDGLSADADGHHRRLPWHDSFNCSLPVDADSDELARCGQKMLRGCEAASVRPLVIRARLVYPEEFNELCDTYGSKGAALSHVTIGLLREVLETAREIIHGGDRIGRLPLAEASSPVFALCDKHGARNRYTALLQHHFSEHWIETLSEGHTESCYEFGPTESRVLVSFRMQGEAFLPTALASMTAKYLRELSMRAFNEFWCARVPGLRPTAGYPMDAPRYKREIKTLQRELGIEDRVLWRNR